MTLQPGKLPAELLAQLLARVPHDDPRLLLGPGLGRDAAAIDMGGGRVLVIMWQKGQPCGFRRRCRRQL